MPKKKRISNLSESMPPFSRHLAISSTFLGGDIHIIDIYAPQAILISIDRLTLKEVSGTTKEPSVALQKGNVSSFPKATPTRRTEVRITEPKKVAFFGQRQTCSQSAGSSGVAVWEMSPFCWWSNLPLKFDANFEILLLTSSDKEIIFVGHWGVEDWKLQVVIRNLAII